MSNSSTFDLVGISPPQINRWTPPMLDAKWGQFG